MTFDMRQMIFEKSTPITECGCWIWTSGVRGDGYGALHVAGERRQIAAHRASWVAHRGTIPDGMFVCHVCDEPLCVNPDHLFLGTAQDNAADRDRKGRTARDGGEAAAASKLTASQALSIYADDRPRGVIAADFGVDTYTVYAIQVGKTWRSVTGGVARYRGVAAGEAAGKAKLTVAQVLAIRADNRPQRAVARDYGISPTTVRNIKIGRNWRTILEAA